MHALLLQACTGDSGSHGERNLGKTTCVPRVVSVDLNPDPGTTFPTEYTGGGKQAGVAWDGKPRKEQIVLGKNHFCHLPGKEVFVTNAEATPAEHLCV